MPKERISSFDVTFCPMVNVKVPVKDPLRPTEQEMKQIIQAAVSAVAENFSEKISGENLDEIRIYHDGGVDQIVYPEPEPVEVVCYGEKSRFPSRKAAEDFYWNCVLDSEGAERDRYINILTQLREGRAICFGD